MPYRYGFIGGGNMATALLSGLIERRVCRPDDILVSDVSIDRRNLLSVDFLVSVTEQNSDVAEDSECLVLAVKPQTLGLVATEIANHLSKDQTVISILAGIPAAVLREKLGGHERIVRVMPNLPATIGKGVAAIAETPPTPEDSYGIAESLLQTVGTTTRVTEDLMDAVTAISGSGPGYVFRMAEILVKAGIEVGLSPDQADALVRQTLLGASEMLSLSLDSAGDLCRKVCSPGGTTLAGLEAMAVKGLEEALVSGVKAARNRSMELSKI
jgi:pyrroline-5-carboxylate reductase